MTGLFGGIDLGSPAQRTEAMLRRELELRRNRWNRGERYIYRGCGDLLLQHGNFYQGRTIPERYVQYRGAQSHCFENALLAAEADPSLRYCEGLYATGEGFPTLHGWCIDPEGKLVELTFPSLPEELARAHSARTELPVLPPEHWGYFGITFDVRLARAHGEKYGLPMFERSGQEVQSGAETGLCMDDAHDFPIFTVAYDPTRTEAP